jgi:DNA topoisomerase-1
MLAREKGLHIVGLEALTLTRNRCGKGFRYRTADGRPVADGETLARLKSLAVPPAYRDVRYADDPKAHLQAIGTDAAGRLQYRYHPRWTEVREAVKARRLARLARALPEIDKAVAAALRTNGCSAEFCIAACVRLVSLTAIRAGGEAYAREHGTRGATTLLKSNIHLQDDLVTLAFPAKGGKKVVRDVDDARLGAALARLIELPGRALFQYRDDKGELRRLRAGEVNDFLKRVVGRRISLKDFRTLVGSLGALEALAGEAPAASERARRSQVRSAIAGVADQLANTPTICRKSYVHESVVSAFEEGKLARLRKPRRSTVKKARLLARIVEGR